MRGQHWQRQSRPDKTGGLSKWFAADVHGIELMGFPLIVARRKLRMTV